MLITCCLLCSSGLLQNEINIVKSLINNEMKLYTIATIGTSLLFLFLFIQLFFTPDAFIEDLGLQTSVPIPILGRRTAMFMLGFSVLLFGARKISHCETRQWICLSTGITMFGLAILSSYEMIRQTVNNSIWTAIILETTSACLFFLIYINGLRNSKNRDKSLSSN